MNPHQGQFQKGQLVPGTSYRVEELIGTGGMGSVYRVEHAELGRRFVLKALHGHLATRQDLVARLKNEWRALGKLEHPNIVQVTDAGQTQQGLPYYVMEHLRGSTLGQLLLSRKRLGAREACLLVVDILAGLHAAHETGAVHRDIKPPNIFVVEGGRAKLLDFGIAKLRDQSAKVVTAGGISIGTPRYMAPEQASGTVVDGRADIYATALVLYEMVVGKGPFAHIKDPNELVMAHIGLEPERADFVDPRVPTELGDLIQRWLSKSPSSRPANAEFARRELLALAQSLPDEEQSVGEEVTVGGVYDASTLGAAVPQGEAPRADATEAASSPRPAASSLSSSRAASTSVGMNQSKSDAILEGREEEGAELLPTVSLVAREKSKLPTTTKESACAGTLGWGTVDDPAGENAEHGVAGSSREGDTPRPRRPSRRVSVTPPPVSSLRSGGLDPNRTTLKWIGGTAAISFLIALGVSQWFGGASHEVAPSESAGSQAAVPPPGASPAPSDGKKFQPVAESASFAARSEAPPVNDAPRTLLPPPADEPASGRGDGSSGSSVSLGSAPASSASAPSGAAQPVKKAEAAAARPASSTSARSPSLSAPASPAVKRSTGPRPAPPTTKLGDQLPESGLW